MCTSVMLVHGRFGQSTTAFVTLIVGRFLRTGFSTARFLQTSLERMAPSQGMFVGGLLERSIVKSFHEKRDFWKLGIGKSHSEKTILHKLD